MAGRLLLLGRLLVRDLRRRRLETVLLVVAITAAIGALTMAMALRATVDQAYQRTKAATAGPDLIIEPAFFGDEAVAALEKITTKAGVTGHSAPRPLLFKRMTVNGDSVNVVVEGRGRQREAVDRPVVTDGDWVSPGVAVVERGFAAALGMEVGDVLTVDGHRLPIAGTAVTVAHAPYPSAGWHEPGSISLDTGGLIWVDQRDIAGLAGGQPLTYSMGFTVADPAADDGFAVLRLPDGSKDSTYRGWNIATGIMRLGQVNRLNAPAYTAMLIGSWLLIVLAAAGVIGIVSGRVAGQRRRVGLLKVVGAGPAMIAGVHLVEYLLIGLSAAVLGVTAGWLGAPVLFRPAAGAIGATGVPVPPASMLVTALVLAALIAVGATLGQVVRAARTGTVEALADAADPPRRHRWTIGLSRRMPVPLLLGMRITARRPRRSRLVTVNSLVTTAGLAAALTVMAREPDLDVPGYSAMRDDRLTHALMLVLGMVVVLALFNTLVSTWTSALDARHTLAVARALGATPGQTGLGLAAAQLLPALPGVALGVPVGVWLAATRESAPLWSMVAAVLGVLLVTALPAAHQGMTPASLK
ncbi:ABC transporter permease [Actinoplanes rectilineatus]|uniref:ABC transporter permease n=1 Tax=Actinoplanes rectilineatus TaxID=113571 RepID=UPI0005F2D847|nr:FtsX-like permease family protein [Actinoplanes rectilineatus]